MTDYSDIIKKIKNIEIFLEGCLSDRMDLHDLKSDLGDLKDKVEDLEKDGDDFYQNCVNKLEKLFELTCSKSQEIPYKCPVCDGEGINKNKLVADRVIEPCTFNMKNPDCKSCDGKGILWR